MRKIAVVLSLVVAGCIISPTLNAEEGHEHEHKQVGGPKGGRLLENTDPQAEFYVENDKSITVTFYDHDLKPVPVADQKVVVIADSKEGKKQIKFERKGDVLMSTSNLPDDHGVNLVVQITQAPEATPQNFRFVYEDHVCGVCKRAEYACICEH